MWWIAVLASSAAVAAASGVGWLRRRWAVVRVRGSSMSPALRDGDLVLVRRCAAASVAAGTIVVVESPDRDHRWTRPPAGGAWAADRQWMVKRVGAVPGQALPDGIRVPDATSRTVPPGALVVLGDSDGYDSRAFGPLPFERLRGVVVRELSSGTILPRRYK